MADHNKEKNNLQRIKEITTLYFWLCFVARSEASHLYVISVGLLIPPKAENTRGVNDALSISRTRYS